MVIVSRVLMFAVVASCIGCSSRSSVVPVSGVVTLDGKPLSNAYVAFQPVVTSGEKTPGPGSYGNTDVSGAYSLRLMDNDELGAVVGNHRVEITLKTESDDRDPKSRPPTKNLPLRYNRQSELQFKIEPGGTKAANFELKSQ
jgi:hypothetical protein